MIQMVDDGSNADNANLSFKVFFWLVILVELSQPSSNHSCMTANFRELTSIVSGVLSVGESMPDSLRSLLQRSFKCRRGLKTEHVPHCEFHTVDLCELRKLTAKLEALSSFKTFPVKT